MYMELKQQVKMAQQLRMTPQLQQAIKLLQLSRMELAEVVSQEMVENPALEEVSDYGEATGDDAKPDDLPTISEAKQNDPDEVPEYTKAEDTSREHLEAWEAYLNSSGSPLPTNNYRGMSSEDLPGIEQTLTRSEDLYDHLNWQLSLSQWSDQERNVAGLIIGNLDENGYLANASLEEIAEATESDLEYVEEILEMIQEFDPVGVAARDLGECLLIQAKHFYPDNELLRKVISGHIPNLERKRYDLIARDLGVSLDEVIEQAKLISMMEPKPGRSYTDTEPQYITPDIYVYKVGDEYVAMVNDDGIPKLKISNFYRDALQNGEKAEAKKYIQEKVKNAAWLIQSIYRRQRTILKVTQSIIRFQRDFLDQGINHLRPLVLRDVAEDIGMHESTISRVTTNKYVHTPQGIFELKYFFNSSISKVEGEDIASEAVKTKIKKIIEAEDPKKPYSDSKIVKLLHDEHNIDIARRTVAKYREMLGILSSTKRKRLF